MINLCEIRVLSQYLNHNSLTNLESHIAFIDKLDFPVKCNKCSGFVVYREKAYIASELPTGFLNTIWCKLCHANLDQSQETINN
jgi:hypothetical protein